MDDIYENIMRKPGIEIYNNDGTTLIGKTSGMVGVSHGGKSGMSIVLIPDESSGLEKGTKITFNYVNPKSLQLNIVDTETKFQVFKPGTNYNDQKSITNEEGITRINGSWEEKDYDSLITFINEGSSDKKIGAGKHKSRRRRKSGKKSRKSRRRKSKKSRKTRRRRRR